MFCSSRATSRRSVCNLNTFCSALYTKFSQQLLFLYSDVLHYGNDCSCDSMFTLAFSSKVVIAQLLFFSTNNIKNLSLPLRMQSWLRSAIKNVRNDARDGLTENRPSIYLVVAHWFQSLDFGIPWKGIVICFN